VKWKASGYPSGGNYWSDYNGKDVYSGPCQNVTGSDGIGDTPYVIDGDNRDNYPIMKPYPWGAHDVGVTSVTASKNVVGQGYNASISVMVFNYGNDTETVKITIYANQTIIGEIYNINLTSRNFTITPFTWNTSGFAKGNYTISAVADTVAGETDTEDNTCINGVVMVTIPGDVDGSRRVEMVDMWLIQKRYGAVPGNSKWEPNCDVDGSGRIEMLDMWITQKHFGEHW
jgi:hypothetical protein